MSKGQIKCKDWDSQCNTLQKERFLRCEDFKILSDEQLMLRLAYGDEQALSSLFFRYGEAVKRCLTRFAPELCVADTEELCQEVFLVLYRSANRYIEQKHFKSWLLGIAVKKAKIWRRNHWLRIKLLNKNGNVGVAMALPLHAQIDDQLELREEVAKVLRCLSKSQREVLLLHALDGFSGVEIAAILNVKESVVWTRLHRARQKIAQVAQRSRSDVVFQGGA